MRKHNDKLLRHIAFIMDGNRRWANKNKLKFTLGHRNGLGALEKVLKSLLAVESIEEVTLYVFSSENWKRERLECDFLFNLLVEKLPKLVKTAVEDNIKLCFVGDLDDLRIPKNVREAISRAHAKTAHCTRLKLNLAFNFGASVDELHMVKAIAKKVAAGEIDPEKIKQHHLHQYRLSCDVTQIDLVVRTGGDFRTSNFFEEQTRYAEWIFLQVLWPDFSVEQLHECLAEFKRRERRYGGSTAVRDLNLAD